MYSLYLQSEDPSFNRISVYIQTEGSCTENEKREGLKQIMTYNHSGKRSLGRLRTRW